MSHNYIKKNYQLSQRTYRPNDNFSNYSQSRKHNEIEPKESNKKNDNNKNRIYSNNNFSNNNEKLNQSHQDSEINTQKEKAKSPKLGDFSNTQIIHIFNRGKQRKTLNMNNHTFYVSNNKVLY